MLHTLGAAAAGGLISALLYLLVTSGGMEGVMLAYLAPLPMFAAGFAFGRQAVVAAAVVGIAGMGVLTGSVFTVAAYALTVALPVVVVVRSAILVRTGKDGEAEWFPVGCLLMRLAGLALVGLVLAAFLAAGEPGGLRGLLQETLSSVLNAYAQAGAGVDAKAMAAWISAVVPGLTGMSWLIMMAVNGLLGQGLVSRFGTSVRPSPALRDIKLPALTDAVLAICIAGAFLPDPFGFVALNAALIVATLFGFIGLAVVHALAARRASPVLFLTGFYGLVVLLGWPIVLAVGLGLIEHWIGLRRRWSAAPCRGDK